MGDNRAEHFEATLDRMWFALRTTDRYWTPKAGWYHSTKSVAAHCWDNGYPLCQDSDPGKAIYCGPHEKGIGRLCETCRAVLKSRLMHSWRVSRQRVAS